MKAYHDDGTPTPVSGKLQVEHKPDMRRSFARLVTEGLRPIMAKFRTDHSSVALDGPQLTEEERRVMTAA
jgi:hypothetical protein